MHDTAPIPPAQRWWQSLRWRLLLATLAGVAVALLLAGVVLSSLFREHTTRQFQAQLQQQLDQLTALLEPDPQGEPRLKTPLNDPRWQTPYSGLYWQMEHADTPVATPALRSRSLWDTALVVPRDRPPTGAVHSHRLSGPDQQNLLVLERTVQFDPSPMRWRLLVAGNTRELEQANARFSGTLALCLLVLGLALLAAAWAQVVLGLAPLGRLQHAVQAVRHGNTSRLQGQFPVELQPLVQDFNRVLDQNEQVVTRARHMAGNLAHAIKTPLAVLANAATQSASDATALATLVREQVRSARQQVDWHLGRARANASGVPGLRTDVPSTLEALVRVMHKVHAHRDDRPPLQIDIAPHAAPITFAGEKQDLQEMLGNLLDNACLWAHQRVALALRSEGPWLHITLDDDGPGLSAEQRQAVFERGVRADERLPGSGLGLAIAQETAQLYRGQIVLAPSPLGGLRATLSLPADAPVVG
jgi:signal transduction histidine kinase